MNDELAETLPMFRAAVRRLCDAAEEDVANLSAIELVHMCEVECNAEHERSVEAEGKVALLRDLLSKALWRFEERERWVSQAAQALGIRDPSSSAVVESLSRSADMANQTAEKRLHDIWNLEDKVRKLTALSDRLEAECSALQKVERIVGTYVDAQVNGADAIERGAAGYLRAALETVAAVRAEAAKAVAT